MLTFFIFLQIHYAKEKQKLDFRTIVVVVAFICLHLTHKQQQKRKYKQYTRKYILNRIISFELV